jgi:hypothetical protein
MALFKMQALLDMSLRLQRAQYKQLLQDCLWDHTQLPRIGSSAQELDKLDRLLRRLQNLRR